MSAAYLNTRVSLLRSRLGPPAGLADWLDADAEALPGLLGARGLGELASGYAENDPRSLEARIVAILLAETRILLRPLAGPARQFLRYWVERFELSNVKSLIRAKLAGESFRTCASRLLDLGDFARMDAEALMRAEDVAELMRRLERTAYAEIVRNARQAFEDSRDPFMLDATLDRAYYDGLIRRARVQEPALGAGFAALMADLVDRVALVWLLRYRFNYGLPPAQVYYLLPGPGYRLPSSLIRALVGRDDLAGVVAGLPATLAGDLAGCADISELDARLEARLRARAEAVLAQAGPPLPRALAYLILREQGLRDVRAVLRGRRLGLPDMDVRAAVFRTREVA